MQSEPTVAPHPQPGALELLHFSPPDIRQRQSLIVSPGKIKIVVTVPSLPSVNTEEPVPPTSYVAITVPREDELRTIRPSPEGIREVTEWDTGALGQSCAHSFPQLASLLVGENPITLLVRVEMDGHPSEARIVQSSGEALRDTTIEGCVLSHWEIEPRIVDGNAIESWQRIRWLHQGPQRTAQ